MLVREQETTPFHQQAVRSPIGLAKSRDDLPGQNHMDSVRDLRAAPVRPPI